jgi:hypothetical protein
MERDLLQQQFFEQIRKQLPPQISLTDKIADLLNISTDSAYRRINGETLINFVELKSLSLNYKLSIDQFLELENDFFLFSDRSLSVNTSFRFDQYLQTLLNDLSYMSSFDRKRIFYLSKDLPIFYFFAFPEMAAFKCFFWMKNIIHEPGFIKEKFSLNNHAANLVNATRKIQQLYTRIPSVEIWSTENIHSTIRQIEYYKNTGTFTSSKDIEILYKCLIETIDWVEQQAEAGIKADIGSELSNGADFQIYVNDFIIGDNTILVELDDTRFTYINHGVINYMVTRDERFCSFTYDHFQNIIRRSTLISRVNEKDRKRFFNQLRKKVNVRIEALS